MKILVISLAGIGDTLFATPLIHELRLAHPDATIDALVMWAGAQDLLEGNPHLNRTWHKNLIKDGAWSSLRWLAGLRREHYDLSFNTHPQSKREYRVVARIIGARQRFSHAYDGASGLDRWLITGSIPQDYSIHCLENNLRLLRLAGMEPRLPEHRYELYLSPAEQAWAVQEARRLDLPPQGCLGCHVGSGGTKNLALRRWPVERWIELFAALRQSHPKVPILLFGGPEETVAHKAILENVTGQQVLAPVTRNLRQAAALIGLTCRAFVSVDTALMHVAAAMAVPEQFVIETPTLNPTVTPYRPGFRVIPNAAVGGRHLEFYRYDGAGIRASDDILGAIMRSVTADAVAGHLRPVLSPS